ncbi:MAG: hypothetical protein ACRENS_09225, partial [Candidatus Eiseniibacteriota bacterium]
MPVRKLPRAARRAAGLALALSLSLAGWRAPHAAPVPGRASESRAPAAHAPAAAPGALAPGGLAPNSKTPAAPPPGAGAPALPESSPGAASAPAISASAAGNPADSARTAAPVRLLPSGAGTIHFALDVPAPALSAESSGEGPGGALHVTLPGYDDSPGDGVVLPERIVVVAVPPAGDVSVRSLGAGVSMRDGVTLLAVRTPAGRIPQLEADAPARLIEVGWLRDQRIARIGVRPVRYDSDRRRLTSWAHVDVTVDVEAASAASSALESATAPSPDAFELVYHDLLINYDQGRSWRRARTLAAGTMGARAGLRELRRFAVTVSPETSVFAGRPWVKLQITKPGFYKVSFGQLRSTSLFGPPSDPMDQDTTTSVDSLRLFTWPGIPVLPENSFCDSCDYREVALQTVEMNHDGRFGRNNDYFYFYALGASDWEDVYDPARTDSTFLDHPYDSRNFYYLTVATPTLPVGGVPLRIGTGDASVTANPATTPARYGARTHFEQDLEYFPDATPLRAGQKMFWEKWMWHSFATGQSFLTTLHLDGLDAAQPARFRMRVWGINQCAPCNRPRHQLDVTLNSGPRLTQMTWATDDGVTLDTLLTPASAALVEGDNALLLGVPLVAGCDGRQDRSALAWVDIFYQHAFQASGDQLAFDSPATSDNFRFVATGFVDSQPPHLFDVTDPGAPQELTGFSYDPAGANFQLTFERSQSGRRRYRILPDT